MSTQKNVWWFPYPPDERYRSLPKAGEVPSREAAEAESTGPVPPSPLILTVGCVSLAVRLQPL